jgi:ferredoxin
MMPTGIMTISCKINGGMIAMEVRIDREGCIGCGVCEALCSEVFNLIEDGKASITEKYRKRDVGEGKVGNELVACVENARGSCPVSVISTE